MARVPTWAELLSDATKLAQLQNECYRSVHHMLDASIPELDRKLARLKQDRTRDRMQELERRFHALRTKDFAQESPLASPAPEVFEDHVVSYVSSEVPKLAQHRAGNAVRELFRDKHVYKPCAVKKSTSHSSNGFYQRSHSPPKPVYEEIDMDEPEEGYFRFHGTDGIACNNRQSSTPEPVMRAQIPMQARLLRNPKQPQSNAKSQYPQTKGFKKFQAQRSEPVYERIEPTIDDLEHLKPLPLPLSHYLKLNRPNVVEAANRRVAYLRRSAERRKLNASAKTINALDQIRAASRTSSNRGSSSVRSSLRGMTRSSTGPNLTQMRCKLSEQEMKRLTAKTYNRLPEVKKQRVQEVTKHLKVQNYKNKLEYGRRLLENRRRGIINYPLKGHHDDSSVMSSLEESLTDSYGERSADGNKFDQYY